ncbi:hypothetical protein ACS0TY_008697 [Phlomoides rotata]
MGFLSLLEVSSMPMVQVLIICLLGAVMATDKLNLLPSQARKSLNQIVFIVFTPSLMFASLAKTVQLHDIISWWFMPVNVGLTFVVGGILGWIALKLLNPPPHLHDLIIAMCSTGNLGYILLIIIPALCEEEGNPFGDKKVCTSAGLSYVSFSMAIGSFYTWTYTYNLMQSARAKYHDNEKPSNMNFEANHKSPLLLHEDHTNIHIAIDGKDSVTKWNQILGFFHQILEQLMAPPVVAAVIGFVFGSVSWLRNLIIGGNAPFRVINDSIKLLGDGTIPCITLILGGNLTQGLSRSRMGWKIVIAVIIVRYVILPAVGIGVVKAAAHLGFLPSHPLYHFVLMIQFTLPPSMNIGTMTQLFDMGQEECSVLFLWTYTAAAFALTAWSTLFMWILS